MKHRTAFLSLVGALALAGSPLAFVQAAEALSLAQIIAKLESSGYTGISEIEKDDGLWEIEAVSPAGERVELKVDPRDGSIVRERRDD